MHVLQFGIRAFRHARPCKQRGLLLSLQSARRYEFERTAFSHAGLKRRPPDRRFWADDGGRWPPSRGAMKVPGLPARPGNHKWRRSVADCSPVLGARRSAAPPVPPGTGPAEGRKENTFRGLSVALGWTGGDSCDRLGRRALFRAWLAEVVPLVNAEQNRLQSLAGKRPPAVRAHDDGGWGLHRPAPSRAGPGSELAS